MPEALSEDKPLAHFPDDLVEQDLGMSDFRKPGGQTRAALAAAKDKFEVSNLVDNSTAVLAVWFDSRGRYAMCAGF